MGIVRLQSGLSRGILLGRLSMELTPRSGRCSRSLWLWEYHSASGIHGVSIDVCHYHARLITGAFAERMKFSAMILFMMLWATFVYDPLAHWVWGKGGWLRYGDSGALFGALDFAGGTVVH